MTIKIDRPTVKYGDLMPGDIFVIKDDTASVEYYVKCSLYTHDEPNPVIFMNLKTGEVTKKTCKDFLQTEVYKYSGTLSIY